MKYNSPLHIYANKMTDFKLYKAISALIYYELKNGCDNACSAVIRVL